MGVRRCHDHQLDHFLCCAIAARFDGQPKKHLCLRLFVSVDWQLKRGRCASASLVSAVSIGNSRGGVVTLPLSSVPSRLATQEGALCLCLSRQCRLDWQLKRGHCASASCHRRLTRRVQRRIRGLAGFRPTVNRCVQPEVCKTSTSLSNSGTLNMLIHKLD